MFKMLLLVSKASWLNITPGSLQWKDLQFSKYIVILTAATRTVIKNDETMKMEKSLSFTKLNKFVLMNVDKKSFFFFQSLFFRLFCDSGFNGLSFPDKKIIRNY